TTSSRTRPARAFVGPSAMRAGLAALTTMALMLGGCSGLYVSPLAPPPYQAEVAARYDATWAALVRALARENVPLRAIARDSGVIASDDFIAPIGVYADCGRVGSDRLEGEALPARLADLIRKARRLAAVRDRLIEDLAAEWTHALRGQGLSSTDLDELWAGLVEDAVRRGRQSGEGKWTAQAWRHEAQEVIARVREKVEAALGER